MVSSLWKACAEGDVDKVNELLGDGQAVDLEVKDHTGVTPLICAVQTGRAELVKLLLERGADPTNSSSQGPPEHYTVDPALLGLLAAAKNMATPTSIPSDAGYGNDPVLEQAKTYFQPHPGAYYYPGGMPVPPPMLSDGPIAYYPPPPSHPVDTNAGTVGNFPPPDIARMIPCRYYPACRYGAACLFAHPQGPYLQGPLPPPAQYPTPYDTISAPPYPPYYSMNPSSFPPPLNGVPTNPPLTSNPPPPVGGPLAMTHARSGSELAQAPFNHSGIPPPAHYGVVSPVSPSYAHSGPIQVPLSIPALPPPQHPLSAQPRSPQRNIYSASSPSAPASAPSHFMVRRESIGQQQYPPQGIPSTPVEATSPRSPIHPVDGYGPGLSNRDAVSHPRRGGVRRPSFGGMSRKPPCLFFPSGRCRNGDDCRFPHVLPDNQIQQSYFGGRGGHRPRPVPHVNGFTTVEEKFAALTVQNHEGQSAGTNGANGTDSSSRSQSTEPGSRSRSHQGLKSSHFANIPRTADKRVTASRPQRVPSADEFPVLSGSSTPPLRSPGANGIFLNGHGGPTAAQVLQAPPPRKERDSQPGTRGGSPDEVRSAKENVEAINSASSAPAEIVPNNLPLSFAAATTVDISKEVSVSA